VTIVQAGSAGQDGWGSRLGEEGKKDSRASSSKSDVPSVQPTRDSETLNCFLAREAADERQESVENRKAGVKPNFVRERAIRW